MCLSIYKLLLEGPELLELDREWWQTFRMTQASPLSFLVPVHKPLVYCSVPGGCSAALQACRADRSRQSLGWRGPQVPRLLPGSEWVWPLPHREKEPRPCGARVWRPGLASSPEQTQFLRQLGSAALGAAVEFQACFITGGGGEGFHSSHLTLRYFCLLFVSLSLVSLYFMPKLMNVF